MRDKHIRDLARQLGRNWEFQPEYGFAVLKADGEALTGYSGTQRFFLRFSARNPRQVVLEAAESSWTTQPPIRDWKWLWTRLMRAIHRLENVGYKVDICLP